MVLIISSTLANAGDCAHQVHASRWCTVSVMYAIAHLRCPTTIAPRDNMRSSRAGTSLAGEDAMARLVEHGARNGDGRHEALEGHNAADLVMRAVHDARIELHDTLLVGGASVAHRGNLFVHLHHAYAVYDCIEACGARALKKANELIEEPAEHYRKGLASGGNALLAKVPRGDCDRPAAHRCRDLM